jgi:hypothetical protein
MSGLLRVPGNEVGDFMVFESWSTLRGVHARFVAGFEDSFVREIGELREKSSPVSLMICVG